MGVSKPRLVPVIKAFSHRLSKISFSGVLLWSQKAELTLRMSILSCCWGGHYSKKVCLLGLLPLVPNSAGCLFWFEPSVGSMMSSEDCVELEEVLMAGLELWLGASVSVWRATTTGGRSLGLRPLFLPEVAPFLTSAFIPWFSIALVLLLGATWVAAARNQF